MRRPGCTPLTLRLSTGVEGRWLTRFVRSEERRCSTPSEPPPGLGHVSRVHEPSGGGPCYGTRDLHTWGPGVTPTALDRFRSTPGLASIAGIDTFVTSRSAHKCVLRWRAASVTAGAQACDPRCVRE